MEDKKSEDRLYIDGETFARMISNYWDNEQKELENYLNEQRVYLTDEGWALAHECYVKGFWQAYKTMVELSSGLMEAEEIANNQV